jgi:hypothetical protein
MDYIVSLDSCAKEIENLISGTKTMIINGADVKCTPYAMIDKGDILFFINNDDLSEIKAKGIVTSVHNSCRLSVEESFEMIIRNQDKLSLPDELFYKWAGKKYLVLIEIRDIEEVQNIHINVSSVLNENGWYLTKNLQKSLSRTTG